MSGQFNRKDFDQNPNKMKKKYDNKHWNTNRNTSLCDKELLSDDEIRQIEDDNWLENHVPKPSKRENKYRERITELEASSTKTALSKKEEKELKKLTKKYNKLYKYRHADHKSNHTTLKGCLIAFSLVFVLIGITLFSAYSLIVQPITGLTMIELTDLIGGIFKQVDEEKYITQSFDSKVESDKFLTNIQKALFLDTKFTLDDFLKLIPKGSGGTGDENASASDILDQGKTPETGEGEEGDNSGFTGNPYLDELLKNTKFDFSSLKDYDPDKKYQICEITDKMIAGLLQETLVIADKALSEAEENPLPVKISIAESFAVRQVLLYKDSDNVTTMKATLQIKIENLVKDIIAGTELSPTIVNLINTLVPLLLPDSIFINLTITPEKDTDPVFGINNVKEESLKTLLYNLDRQFLDGKIQNIMSQVGTQIFNGFKTVTDIAGNYGIVITPSILDKDGKPVGDGKADIDILQAAMKGMGIKNVTSTDFLLMVKHLHSIDNNFSQEDNYKEYIDNTIDPDDLVKEDSFTSSLSKVLSAYGITDKNDKEFIASITPDNFMTKIGDIPSKVCINDPEIYDSTVDQLREKAVFDDNGVAQMLNSFIATQTNKELPINILSLVMEADTMSIIAKLDIEDIIKAQLGDKLGPLEGLVLSIFPKSLFVKIDVPYTRGADGFNIIFNYSKDPSSSANSDFMFETLENLIKDIQDKDKNDGDSQENPDEGLNFSKKYLIDKLSNIVYDALDQLQNPSSDLPFDIKLDAKGIHLPCAYDIIADLINDDEIDAEKVQDVLANYYKYGGDPIGNELKGNVSNTRLTGTEGRFVQRELISKFFLSTLTGEDGGVYDLNAIDNGLRDEDVLKAIASIGSSLKDEESLAKAINIDKLKASNPSIVSAQDGNLAISSLELAKLISQSEAFKIENVGFYKDFELVDMNITDGTILNAVFAATLNTDYVGGDFNIGNFATELLYVKASVDMDKVIDIGSDKGYETTVTVNDVATKNIDVLFKIINSIADSNGSLNKEEICNNVGKAIYSAFKSFEDQGIKLTPTDNILRDSEKGATDGFTSTNIFQLIADKLLPGGSTEGKDDEMLKSILYKVNNMPLKDDGKNEETFMKTPHKALHNIYTNEKGEEDDTKYKPGNNNEDNDVIDLATFDKETGKLTMTDIYVGRKLRAALKSQSESAMFDILRFYIFAAPTVNYNDNLSEYNDKTDLSYFNEITKQLDIKSHIKEEPTKVNGIDFTKNIYTERNITGGKGMMFMHFNVNSEMFISHKIGVLLPKEIYSGMFIDLNKFNETSVDDGAIICNYLNNLTPEEMDMLTRITQSQDPLTKTLTDKIETLLAQPISFFDGKFEVTIGELLSKATLKSTSTIPALYAPTYSIFEYTLPIPPIG